MFKCILAPLRCCQEARLIISSGSVPKMGDREAGLSTKLGLREKEVRMDIFFEPPFKENISLSSAKRLGEHADSFLTLTT